MRSSVLLSGCIQMQIGIVGLPTTGKTSLFNALTRGHAALGRFGFTSMEPNRGTAHVPDARLDALSRLYEPKKTTPATVDFVDIAGLVKGSSAGEGLGNQFLAHIRNVDAIAHVIRCFSYHDDPDRQPDPVGDMETVEMELILADLQSVEKQKDKAVRNLHKGGAEAKKALDVLEALYEHLSAGKPARELPGADERRDIFMLTDKPVLYVANVAEEYANGGSPYTDQLRSALGPDARIVEISAGIEGELAALPPEEAAEFMTDLELKEAGLDRMARESYALLGLMSFLTAGKDECRAWSIKIGTRAQDAAGTIHSDLARGFIRAEIVNYQDLLDCGSIHAAKEKGLVRREGRDYIMQDGDVMNVLFQV